MTFAAPWWLWELAGVGVFALILVLFAIGSRTSSGRSNHGNASRGVRWPRIARVVASAAGVRPVRAGRTVRRPWLLLLGISGAIFALARPQWGKVDETVVEQAREVIIALDLSRSMLVQDVPPARLERAKLLTKSLLDQLRGERVGIVVFAGTAFVQVPLSSDYQIIHDFLPDLKPDFMPQGGTDYEGMLRATLGAFGDDPRTDRFLIVLSDGESHSADWRQHLGDLRDRSVRVLSLGIGTAAGGFIPDGENSFLKDERGAVVLSKLEPATLQSLARETQGVYRDASAWVDLAALIETTVARGHAGEFATRRNERHLERFQWFLAPAVLFALLGLWREVAVRPRPQTVRRAAPGAKATTALAATLALGLTLPLQRGTAADMGADDAAPTPEDRVRETITRIASSQNPTARDWRELADRTLVYATGARMHQQPFAAGAVHDALAAVDLGEKADPKLTNWQKLRDDLRATLDLPPQEKPPEQPEPPPPDEKPEEKEQENEQEQEQEQEQGQPQQQEPQQPQQQDQAQNEQQQQPQQQPQESPPQQSQPQPSESAMGEMNSQSETPPPAVPQEQATATPPKTRKIGGKPAHEQPPPKDAESAVLLQRLREAADQDSPAELFQLLEGDKKQPAERGKDW